MDADTRTLIRQLCSRAGMNMEDASAIAVGAGSEDRLAELLDAGIGIVALIEAALALHGQQPLA